jgi:hypothetical protein
MNTDLPESERPDAATIEFLKCVFPDGLKETEYFPLLYILRRDMTIRAASWLVGVLMGKHYLEIYNDALGAKSSYKPDLVMIEELTKRLQACSYEEWLKS